MGKKRVNKVINIHEAKNQALQYKRSQTIDIIPRNSAQEIYVDALHDDNNRIIFAIGPAGTGKTMLAVLRAVKALRNKEVSRIVITRPAVAVDGENHGFLPGDINQKMEPWVLPILDVFNEFWSPKEVQQMINDKVIELSPLMYMRGRTFKDSIIVFDEAQNSSPEQMKMILTRLGTNTNIIITGDPDQTDHKKQNGLKDIQNRINNFSPGICMCTFTRDHIERDEIVKTVLNLYGE